MPGLNLNPSIRVVEHRTPESFLSVAYPTLHHHERSSNIILGHALKKVSAEAALTGCRGTFDLEMVLACHRVGQDDLPVFLWTPEPNSLVVPQWLTLRITALADRLVSCVPAARVFSVFGMSLLVKAFSKYWTTLTGFQIEPQPFYSAYLTYCTRETLVAAPDHLSVGHSTRRAMPSDIESVAQLCKEFADDSIHFPLSLECARVEANELISKGQIWIYEVSGTVAAICAVTRTSLNVSAITKVYTCPKWRRRGFAEQLVRYVTRK
ncbi:hypothetical protein BU15DRAFT_70925 [Melanogaster broomeanus]|nr:hypothetical protein BU15DRAFT_70925 [Melanogaster broomeanus]